MLEKTPELSFSDETFDVLINPKYRENFRKIEDEYLYWDKAKYHKPKDIDPKVFWSAVKLQRIGFHISFYRYHFVVNITTAMQRRLHEFDMNYGGTLLSSSGKPMKNKEYYLLSSMMEEAIASSQMEGASTTRRVAKDMLRNHRSPQGRDQQMIANNYNTIRFLSEHKADRLTPELLLEIHKLITENTLDSPEEEGRFRNNDNIAVVNEMSSEVVHIPPRREEIAPFIQAICDFANKDEAYIHPIVKALILHFMISYLHPFADGNGRTARSLFYWYMLKEGYWLTEYLSISRIIYRSKAQYEKAFLYVENDGNDLGYFLNYNLEAWSKAYEEFLQYLERKQKDEELLADVKLYAGVNVRQAKIIRMAMEKPDDIFLCGDMGHHLGVSAKTVRSDFRFLVDKGLFVIKTINRKQDGYVRSAQFNDILSGLEKT